MAVYHAIVFDWSRVNGFPGNRRRLENLNILNKIGRLEVIRSVINQFLVKLYVHLMPTLTYLKLFSAIEMY